MQIRAGVVLDEGRVLPVDLDPLRAAATSPSRNAQVAHATDPVSIADPAREPRPPGNLEKRSSVGETASRAKHATDGCRSQQHEGNPHAFRVIAGAAGKPCSCPIHAGPCRNPAPYALVSAAICDVMPANTRRLSSSTSESTSSTKSDGTERKSASSAAGWGRNGHDNQ